MSPEPLPTSTSRTAVHQAVAQLSAASQAVEVLALTTDHELLGTLRAAVAGEQRRIWHAPGYQDAAELIMAGRVGVAVIDTLTTGAETASLCQQFRRQFPDLILIVAGTVEDQTRLVSQITSGDIYRFLHKPISEARAHQFIETSVRRHLDGRTIAGMDTGGPTLRLPGKPVLAMGGVALAIIVTVILWASGDRAPEPTNEAPVAQNNVPTLQLAPPAASIERSAAVAPTREPPTTVAPVAAPTRNSTPTQTSTPAAAPTNKPVAEEPEQDAVAAVAAVKQPPAATAPPAAAMVAVEEKAPPPPDSAATQIEVASAAVPEKPLEIAQQPAAPAAPVIDPRAAFLANVVPVTDLPRTRQIEPEYPLRARRNGTEGWVELDFTVDTRGAVKDIEAHAANPKGVFDEAASKALAQWKFKPVMREGRAVEQRARVRLRFQLEN